MAILQLLWTPALGLHHCHGHICRGKITQNFLLKLNTFQEFNVIKVSFITLNSQAMVRSNGFSPLASRHKGLSSISVIQALNLNLNTALMLQRHRQESLVCQGEQKPDSSELAQPYEQSCEEEIKVGACWGAQRNPCAIPCFLIQLSCAAAPLPLLAPGHKQL